MRWATRVAAAISVICNAITSTVITLLVIGWKPNNSLTITALLIIAVIGAVSSLVRIKLEGL